MTCALNFIFNGGQISLPGRTVCMAQVSVTWFKGFLPPTSSRGPLHGLEQIKLILNMSSSFTVLLHL